MTGYGLTDSDRADLHARLTSWFGDDRQAFLVSHLAPVVDRIKADAHAAGAADALEMARKANLAERRAEDAEAEVEGLRERWEHVAEGVQGSGGDAWSVSVFIERDCAHEWLDRPESDTAVCELCGAER